MSECNRCAGEGARYNNAAERVTTCGKCSKMEKITYHIEGTRAFLLEEDGATICEIVAPAYNNRAEIAAKLVRACNAHSALIDIAKDVADRCMNELTVLESRKILIDFGETGEGKGAAPDAARNRYAILVNAMWRIAGMDATNSQAAVLAKQEAISALEQAGEK